jgi:hypothetical protein
MTSKGKEFVANAIIVNIVGAVRSTPLQGCNHKDRITWGQTKKKIGSGLGQAHHPEADIAVGILGRGGLAGGGTQVPGPGKPGAAFEET